MSRVIQSFDPSASSTGSIDSGLVIPCMTLVLWNESPYRLMIEFENGDEDILPAWTAQKYEVRAASKLVYWTRLDVLPSSSSAPASIVYGTVYDRSDVIPGYYPVSIVRQTNISNDVSIGGTLMRAQQVYNEEREAGDYVIYSTLKNGNIVFATIALTNEGALVIDEVDESGFFVTGLVRTYIGQQAPAISVQIGDFNKLTSISGPLQCGQDVTMGELASPGANTLLVYHQVQLDTQPFITNQPAWTNITLTAPWVTDATSGPTTGYWKDSYEVVHLRGVIRAGTTSPYTLFTLPAGYRPTTTTSFDAHYTVAGAIYSGIITISSSGVATLLNTGVPAGTINSLILSHIRFRTI